MSWRNRQGPVAEERLWANTSHPLLQQGNIRWRRLARRHGKARCRWCGAAAAARRGRQREGGGRRGATARWRCSGGWKGRRAAGATGRRVAWSSRCRPPLADPSRPRAPGSFVSGRGPPRARRPASTGPRHAPGWHSSAAARRRRRGSKKRRAEAGGHAVQDPHGPAPLEQAPQRPPLHAPLRLAQDQQDGKAINIGGCFRYMKDQLERIERLQEKMEEQNQDALLSSLMKLSRNEMLGRGTPKLEVDLRKGEARVVIYCASKLGQFLTTVNTLDTLGLHIYESTTVPSAASTTSFSQTGGDASKFVCAYPDLVSWRRRWCSVVFVSGELRAPPDVLISNLNQQKKEPLQMYVCSLTDSTTVGIDKVNSDHKRLDVAIAKATNHA